MSQENHRSGFFIGQIIKTADDHWEVIGLDPVQIKVLSCSPQLARYLDVGSTYTMKEHEHWRDLGMLYVGEIPREQMKRSVNQVILQNEAGRPIIDLCS